MFELSYHTRVFLLFFCTPNVLRHKSDTLNERGLNERILISRITKSNVHALTPDTPWTAFEGKSVKLFGGCSQTRMFELLFGKQPNIMQASRSTPVFWLPVGSKVWISAPLHQSHHRTVKASEESRSLRRETSSKCTLCHSVSGELFLWKLGQVLIVVQFWIWIVCLHYLTSSHELCYPDREWWFAAEPFLRGLAHFILGLFPSLRSPPTVITHLKWARACGTSYYAECANNIVLCHWLTLFFHVVCFKTIFLHQCFSPLVNIFQTGSIISLKQLGIVVFRSKWCIY